MVCRRVDTQEAHAERAQLRQQLDRAYDVLKFKRTEERNLTQDVAMVSCCELNTHSLDVDEVLLADDGLGKACGVELAATTGQVT